MELPLGGLEAVVGGLELAQLRLLVGKGLGGADAGEAGLDVGVDDGGALLYTPGCLLHGPPADPDHHKENGQDHGDHQRQPPLNRKHDGQGPCDGDAGDEDVLRSVVGKLGDVEEVRRQAAHELACAVAVKVVKAQLLHMAEQVPANVRLHQDAEGVAPVANDIGQRRPQDEGRQHHRHDGEEGLVGTFRQQLVHAPAGDVGKGQVDEGDHQRTAKIHEKKPSVGFEIGEKYLQCGFLLKFPGGHGNTPYHISIQSI